VAQAAAGEQAPELSEEEKWANILAEAEVAFMRVSVLCDGDPHEITKEELVKAQRG
jgi:hypothetical protein